MSAVDPLGATILKDDTTLHYWQSEDGCEVAPVCLECPLPYCRFDETLQQQTSKVKVAIVRYLERDNKLNRAAVSKILKLSRNTVTNFMFKYKSFTNEELQEYFDCDYLVDLVFKETNNGS